MRDLYSAQRVFTAERANGGDNWFSREQIHVIRAQMVLETGRLEKRFAVAIPMRITSLDRLGLTEEATTENVSFFGARMLVKREWRRGEEIILETPTVPHSYRATVIYCQRLEGGETAIGVHLTAENIPVRGNGQIR
jgi:hypothetical protein